MSKANSTAKLMTMISMPAQGGVEVPMICPCCGTKLGARSVFADKDAHGTMPQVSALIACRHCSFEASIWVGESKVSIAWGGGDDQGDDE